MGEMGRHPKHPTRKPGQSVCVSGLPQARLGSEEPISSPTACLQLGPRLLAEGSESRGSHLGSHAGMHSRTVSSGPLRPSPPAGKGQQLQLQAQLRAHVPEHGTV